MVLIWSLNTSSNNKKAQQHLYLLQRLRKAHLPPPILTMFHRGTNESILSSCITAWFGNCTVFVCKTLQRIVRTAEKIIGVSFPSITDMYTTCCIRKANSIVDDPTHPSHTLFTFLKCLSEVKMGRGSPIPPMLRPKIVEQYQKGVSQRKIAKSLKLSSSTVHNIIQRLRESGTISVRKGQGRKTILDARDLRALRRHCITYRNATVMEITTWTQEYFQKTLSVNTIHRAIRRCRLKLYRSKKKPYLNMIQKRRRFLWAKAHLKWTVAKWKTVLWSDESKFEVLFGKLGRHVIRIKEDKNNPSCYQRSVQKPASLMVWGCMSACGMGSLHIWKGTINAERFGFELVPGFRMILEAACLGHSGEERGGAVNRSPPGGELEAAEAYRQAKQAAAQVVSEAKTLVWEEFGEAMEKDYRMASGKFWLTVWCLRRGKQFSANTVYSGGGELLASTGDTVGRWKE
ncbi:hypothetical protein QTP86_000816 [Hemibagrus guttatus]|nr:hypothetical protein QTP86_000816 [Hemibagrus guttatus]